jgi:hypothetical protein
MDMGTYSKINTTELSSLLSFERESIDGHQTNDKKEGIDEHFRSCGYVKRTCSKE